MSSSAARMVQIREELRQAVESGTVEDVERVVEAAGELRRDAIHWAPDHAEEDTALRLAIRRDDAAMVTLLAEHFSKDQLTAAMVEQAEEDYDNHPGSDPNSPPDTHLAAFAALVLAGVDGDIDLSGGYAYDCILIRAAKYERWDIVHALAAHVPPNELVVSYAADAPTLDTMRVLLEAGHWPDGNEWCEVSALLTACASENIAMAKLLLEHGADPNWESCIRNAEDLPIMREALCSRNDELIRLLVAHGGGLEALFLSCWDECLDLFVRHGVDVNQPSWDGQTALHDAVVDNRLNAVERLIAAGAHVDCCDRHECTPLNYAVRDGWVNIVRVLLQHGADCNVVDGEGCTPLHHAVRDGSVDFVRVLLQHGADCNVVDDEGCTPLETACHYRNHRAALALVRAGALYTARMRDDASFPAVHDTVRRALVLRDDITPAIHRFSAPVAMLQAAECELVRQRSVWDVMEM